GRCDLGCERAHVTRFIDCGMTDMAVEVAIRTLRQAERPVNVDAEVARRCRHVNHYRPRLACITTRMQIVLWQVIKIVTNSETAPNVSRPVRVAQMRGRGVRGLCRAAA